MSVQEPNASAPTPVPTPPDAGPGHRSQATQVVPWFCPRCDGKYSWHPLPAADGTYTCYCPYCGVKEVTVSTPDGFKPAPQVKEAAAAAAVPSDQKPLLRGLVRDNPLTPEGKYLVLRRDGTVPPWPSFVLGGADPYGEVALRAYAYAVSEDIARLGDEEAERRGLTVDWVMALIRWAGEFHAYREQHGQGDPGRGIHRKDDPNILALMRLGRSA